ncbi:uncharacterized protein LOC143793702 [Ranitomeya variabilis]|uniref:uncharacterized protein LOC143793702 n=1 Tax=Ranitomeya variabilis TaxID=490064 RepID=UPI004056D917
MESKRDQNMKDFPLSPPKSDKAPTCSVDIVQSVMDSCDLQTGGIDETLDPDLTVALPEHLTVPETFLALPPETQIHLPIFPSFGRASDPLLMEPLVKLETEHVPFTLPPAESGEEAVTLPAPVDNSVSTPLVHPSTVEPAETTPSLALIPLQTINPEHLLENYPSPSVSSPETVQSSVQPSSESQEIPLIQELHYPSNYSRLPAYVPQPGVLPYPPVYPGYFDVRNQTVDETQFLPGYHIVPSCMYPSKNLLARGDIGGQLPGYRRYYEEQSHQHDPMFSGFSRDYPCRAYVDHQVACEDMCCCHSLEGNPFYTEPDDDLLSVVLFYFRPVASDR